MKTAIVTLKSESPYSQGRFYDTPKNEREIPKDFEARTWRDRLHATQSGEVFIPPMALKNALAEAAKYMGIQIPGKGKSTYTKHFEAGILVTDPLMLGIQKDAVQGEWLFVPADGVRGSGKRVQKCFPFIPEWRASTQIFVFDEMVTEEVLRQHLDAAGQFIGMGRFRPRNNGFYGRFSVEKWQWR